MPIRFCVAGLFALLLAACNPVEQLEISEQKIDRWQATYNRGDAGALYGQTSPAFRDEITREQMDELVALVIERMGKVESSERAGFNVKSNNGVTTTIVTMTTTFEKGEGTETFTFQGGGDDTGLMGWEVDSPNFLKQPEVSEAVEPEPAD